MPFRALWPKRALLPRRAHAARTVGLRPPSTATSASQRRMKKKERSISATAAIVGARGARRRTALRCASQQSLACRFIERQVLKHA
eukprot:946140-Prymnesium_polylepis.2